MIQVLALLVSLVMIATLVVMGVGAWMAYRGTARSGSDLVTWVAFNVFASAAIILLMLPKD